MNNNLFHRLFQDAPKSTRRGDAEGLVDDEVSPDHAMPEHGDTPHQGSTESEFHRMDRDANMQRYLHGNRR